MHDEVLLIARPPASLRDAVEAELRAHGLADAMKRWPSSNWHQSLSQKHAVAHRPAIAHAMGSLVAPSFELVFNRIAQHGDQWHVCTKGHPDDLRTLLSKLRPLLSDQGIEDPGAHSPHITISYRAPRPLTEAVPIRPLSWQVNEIELVLAGGAPYRYTTLERWSLAPPRQADLF